MPIQPGKIMKTTISKRIDDLSRDPLKRDAFLKDLEKWERDYFEVLITHGVLKRGAEEQHYREHWFNYNNNSWWRDHPHIAHFEPIHRRGMIEAFQASIALNKPIDTYWICNGDLLEICVCWSEQQITRIILTPSIPPLKDDQNLTQKQSIHVTKFGEPELGEEEVYRDPNGHFVTVRPRGFPYDSLYD